ncbi:hypothetical protein ACIBJE_05175 [Micromonospora sp. NPDC050187]|uniref:hypothetical protein n=1 Tax=Micromonospora sp. NPDC050187 TaxID=3364277 RepID=UPI0037AC1280
MVDVRVLGVGDWKLWRELRLAALAEAGYAFGAQLADWQGDRTASVTPVNSVTSCPTACAASFS